MLTFEEKDEQKMVELLFCHPNEFYYSESLEKGTVSSLIERIAFQEYHIKLLYHNTTKIKLKYQEKVIGMKILKQFVR